MRLTEIITKEDCTLRIKTDNGKTGLFDVKSYLESEDFAPLKDKGKFARIRNGGNYIEWECGADLSLDTIEAKWRVTANAQQGVPDGSPNAAHP